MIHAREPILIILWNIFGKRAKILISNFLLIIEIKLFNLQSLMGMWPFAVAQGRLYHPRISRLSKALLFEIFTE